MTLAKTVPDENGQAKETLNRKEMAVLRRAINRVLAKGATESLQLTIQECRNIEGKKVLYMNCGTGHMVLQLARKGASVLGIDPSLRNTQVAILAAKKEKLQDKCQFICGDFSKLAFNGKFDITIALGIFDYARDPAFIIKKMRTITRGKCIMSFPARFAFQVPLRIIWSRSRNIPLNFYTKKELKYLFQTCFQRYRIKDISAGYHCIALAQNLPGLKR